jgi:hypothetical protein
MGLEKQMSKAAKAIERRCGECGLGKVRPVKGQGRVASYKNMKLEIPADMDIPTCDNCGSEWLDRAGIMELDAALEKIYRELLRELFEENVSRLRDDVSMRRVESALGLSEGYLSKAKQGRSEPSASLVSSLALLARDTEAGLAILERLWRRGAEASDSAPAEPLSGRPARASRARDLASMPSYAEPVKTRDKHEELKATWKVKSTRKIKSAGVAGAPPPRKAKRPRRGTGRGLPS